MFAKALIANLRYGFPSRGLICYGVTGTDGKSTTSAFLYHLLKSAGYQVGLISTVFIDIGDGQADNDSKLTSLPPSLLCKLLKQAKANGITHVIIEASSHALYQYRLWPIRFAGVGFTNLTREHLDFHWTMKHYFRTKLRLFREYARR